MSETMRPGEFGYIDWIRAQQKLDTDATTAAGAWSAVPVGPGDDCAVILAPTVGARGDQLLVTTDMMLEGTHFRLSDGAFRIGRKLLAVSVSDIAAMGGVPMWAVTSVGFAQQPSTTLKAELWAGLHAAAKTFGVALVGGDVTAWRTDTITTGSAPPTPSGLVLSLTLIGQMLGDEPVLRSGGSPGDVLFVTGELGGSIRGHHLDFQPRLEVGRFLAQHRFATAMLDISDGLSGDVAHIAEESRVGVCLDAQAIPISAAARAQAGETGRDPLDHALNDGEDFELVFSVVADRADELEAVWPFAPRIALSRIGRLRPADRGLVLRYPNGRETPLVPHAWDHLATSPDTDTDTASAVPSADA